MIRRVCEHYVGAVPAPSLVVLAVISALQGLFFVGYAVYDIVQAFRVGLTGPAEVSNPAALLGLIAITAAIGVALLWVARGWWRVREWARAPFLVAQLVLGLIGYDLSQSQSSGPRLLGQVLIVVAVVGVVTCFLPSVRRALDVAEGR